MTWRIERDLEGVPARMAWSPSEPCQHGKIRKGKPLYLGSDGCVNVSEFCALCGRKLATVSWNRKAWDEHRAKQATKEQASLFAEVSRP